MDGAKTSTFRVETEINGRKFALYNHLPGFAHRRQPTEVASWEGRNKEVCLSESIKEDASFVIVKGDFNEWTDGVGLRLPVENDPR